MSFLLMSNHNHSHTELSSRLRLPVKGDVPLKTHDEIVGILGAERIRFQQGGYFRQDH